MEQVHRHLRIRLGSMVAVGTAKGSCSTTVAMVSILVSTQGLIQAMVEGGTAVEAFVVLDEGTVGAVAADMDISAARTTTAATTTTMVEGVMVTAATTEAVAT